MWREPNVERAARRDPRRSRPPATRPPPPSSPLDGRVLSSIVSSQADLHARFGGVVPEVASRRHLELVAPVIRAALESADVPLERVDRVAVTQGPGLVGALLVGISAAKALAWSKRLPARPRRPPRGARRVSLPRARPAGAAVHMPAREWRAHAAPRGARAWALGAARRDARRRGRRGVRQGRPAARARLPGRCSARPARRRRRPGRIRLSRRARVRVSTSRSRASRPRSCTPCATLAPTRPNAARPTSRRRTSARSCARSSAALRDAADATGLDRIAVVGGVAANSELRAALPDARFAPLELCTDNAAMIASCARFVEPLPYPRYLALDAYASLS